MLGKLSDVKVWRGVGGGMSGHLLVEARLKLVGGWRSSGSMEGVRNALKVSELNNSMKKRAHQERLRGQHEVRRDVAVVSLEKEWEQFRDIIMECTNDVCGMRRVGGQRRNVSEWWNEEVGGAVAEKRRAFEEWLQRRATVSYDRYRAQRVVLKRAVKVAKRVADWRWGERRGNDFEGNKKCFGKR